MAWLNNDGLYIKYGREQGTAGRGGQFAGAEAGDTHVVEVTLNLTELNTSTYTILSDAIRLPRDYRVKAVEVFVTTAATGATATLDVGIRAADRVTEVDHDGLVAALAVAAMDTVGERTNIEKGSTGAGALVGSQLPATAKGGYLVAKAGTAAFTAGVVKVKVFLVKN